MTESFPEERLDALEKLATCAVSLDESSRALRRFEWDYDGPTFVVTKSHVVSIVKRYMNGGLSADNIELWANLLEGRDDISFEPGYENVLSTLVYELANPLLDRVPSTQRRPPRCWTCCKNRVE